MNREIVSVYRSSKKAETYVYVPKKEGFNCVPDALKTIFGQPVHVMDMLLTEDKKLARVDAERVLEEMADKGFYLQMPPAKDDYMLDLYKDPEA